MRMVCLLSLCLLVTGCTGSSSSGDAVVDAMVDTGAPVEDASAGTGDGANSGDRGLTEAAEEYRQEPTWWSPEATQVVADLRFIQVDGTPFFALGLHVSAGLTYDGIAGPGECDKSTGKGYLDINVEKTHEAAAAGANFAFLWGYGNDMTQELLDVTPRFKGRYHGEYGQVLPEEDDVIPILLNDHGEVDLDGFDPDKVVEMEEEFADFMARTGKYSPDNMPNLPPVEQVGHMAWHPTFRMIGTGDGDGEMLTSEQATALAQTMNMMIGDTYTYVENRFDWNDPAGAIMAAGTGQKGDIGEGYDDWLAADDPDHRSMFDSGFELAQSLRSKSKPDAVVWMWLQGYSFGRSIQHSECRGKSDDSWAAGGFPPLTYLVKEATGMIAAGATGFIFFGYPETLPEEAEIIHTFLSALGHEEVYGPILLSPRLDLGIDTLFMGEEGYDGKGRVHAVVKWHEASRTAAIVASNPGARATAVTFPFPWSLESAELLDWEAASFAPDDALQIVDRSLSFSMPPDSGMIVRVVPRMHP